MKAGLFEPAGIFFPMKTQQVISGTSAATFKLMYVAPLLQLPDQSVGRVGVDAVLAEPVEQAIVHLEGDPGFYVPDVVAAIGARHEGLRDLRAK